MTKQLLLGVDGGGTKTSAHLATLDAVHQTAVIGRGKAGSSNCRSVGIETATENLQTAIRHAFADAGRPSTTVSSACLALAGADRADEQALFRDWAAHTKLAERLTLTNDAMPVLYAAAQPGIGIALISGTGSVAVGRNEDGNVARCGGWGSLLGDQGSGYQIALAALRASARAADGYGNTTVMLQQLLNHFQLEQPSELIPTIYSLQTSRSTIAALAPLVFRAAESGDEVAASIVDQAAIDLADLVNALAKRLKMSGEPFALAVSGGVLLHQQTLVSDVCRHLNACGLEFSLTAVAEPVVGAVAMAKVKVLE